MNDDLIAQFLHDEKRYKIKIQNLLEENKNQFDTGYRYGVKESLGEIEKLKEENKKLKELLSEATDLLSEAMPSDDLCANTMQWHNREVHFNGALKELEGEK